MTGRVMLEKRIEVPAQIAKRKFTRQSCRGFESVDMVIIIAYNNIYAGSKTFADVNI